MSESIRLSPKHGLNPSLTHCMCCGKEYGIALLGKLKDDAEAPKSIYHGLCEDCEKVVEQGGVMLIEVKDGEKSPNPYRTGRVVGCTKDFKERMGIENPIVYMEETIFSNLFNDYLNNEKRKADCS